MKKWLIRCLTVLAMVCLIPGIVLNVKAADSIYTYCFVCMQQRNYEILGYTKVDSTKHRIHIKCSVCGRKNSIVYGDLSDHTGGTETPTCTTGKTCEKCGGEYGILGHDWGEWKPNGDNKTHIRTCKREGCNAVDTANCGGDGTATCVTQGTCTVCGQPYYGGHYFAKPYTYGYDENTHWYACSYCEKDEKPRLRIFSFRAICT